MHDRQERRLCQGRQVLYLPGEAGHVCQAQEPEARQEGEGDEAEEAKQRCRLAAQEVI